MSHEYFKIKMYNEKTGLNPEQIAVMDQQLAQFLAENARLQEEEDSRLNKKKLDKAQIFEKVASGELPGHIQRINGPYYSWVRYNGKGKKLKPVYLGKRPE